MLIKWNERTQRWFHDASEHTGFHRRLAEIMRPYIKLGGTMCDLGCGMGLIDFELCDSVEMIDCIDREPEAIRLLSADIEARGVQNMRAILADATMLSDVWDTAIMTFHGTGEDILTHYLKLSRGNVVAVVHAEEIGNFGPRAYKTEKTNTVRTVTELIEARGLDYMLIQETIEYGQPLWDYEDARAFVSAYSRSAPEGAVEEFLHGNLVETRDRAYPFYLPREKPVGIFVLKGAADEKL